MLFLAGITITFFLAIILFSKKGKTIADLVLAVWLCVIGIHLSLFYLFISGEIYKYPWLLGLAIPLPLFHGPFLYIYVLAVTRPGRLSPKNWLHFLVPLACYGYLGKFLLLPGTDKINVFKNEGAGYEFEMMVIMFTVIISGFAYVFLSLYALRNYRKQINEEFSNTEKIDLNWLRYLIFGILAIWLVVLMDMGDPMVFGTVVVFVVLLGYFGIKHVGIFTYSQSVKPTPISIQPMLAENEPIAPMPRPVIESIETIEIPVKYRKSALQKETADKIYHDLTGLMKSEKLFKNEDLSLAQLAQQLDVHPNNLSQVINSYENKSFYDYINHLRVEEFKELTRLPANKNYTLLSLALECGFNSKTSFNRNFKKISGQSPSAYLKEANIQFAEE